MAAIGPKFTHAELAQTAAKTIAGNGSSAGLPGVVADAKTMDPDAHSDNRKLAGLISKAVASVKNPNGDTVPPFVLAWRLYPNKDSTVWDDKAETHACGCGC